MKRYAVRPGVVLLEIEGIFLLCADREARKACSYVREIDEVSAFIYKEVKKGKDCASIESSIREEYDVPEGTDLLKDILSCIQSLYDNHYLLDEEEDS